MQKIPVLAERYRINIGSYSRQLPSLILFENGKEVQRFPLIIHLGAAVLAFTAASMIIGEPLLDPVFDPQELIHTAARWFTYAVAILGVLGAGWWTTRRATRNPAAPEARQAA